MIFGSTNSIHDMFRSAFYSIQLIGKALLPLPVTSKALPAPTEANPGTIGSTTERVESVPGVSDAPSKVEAVAEPTAEINSVPKAEVETDSLPGISRPLSPYPNVSSLRLSNDIYVYATKQAPLQAHLPVTNWSLSSGHLIAQKDVPPSSQHLAANVGT